MEVQNISGSDIVSREFSTNTNINNENVTIENKIDRNDERPEEENKGTIIDYRV